MISAMIIRNIKTYHKLNFVPLSFGQPFCGYIGENGIGKSSILEALDSFFNGRTWNINNEASRSGIDKTNPQICVIFVIEKLKIDRLRNNNPLPPIADTYSNYLWNLTESTVAQLPPELKKLSTAFIKHVDELKKYLNPNDNYLFLVGQEYNRNDQYYLSFLETVRNFKETILGGQDAEAIFDELRFWSEIKVLFDEIVNGYEYIYIPEEIDAESFTKIENKTVQKLMGKSLEDQLQDIVTNSIVQQLNEGLNRFLSSIEGQLSNYVYKKPALRQKNLQKSDLIEKIIDAYFSIRVLNKKSASGTSTPVAFLSSGEKRKALIDITYAFLNQSANRSKITIIAIDEPESSLHVSACYDQFDKLFRISEVIEQLIICTHWYGFLPIVTNGNINIMSKKEEDVHFDSVNLFNYREQVSHAVSSSKGRLPVSVNLKSINDLTQSIISSVQSDDYYNWIICEGSSEKIYFSAYFKEEINVNRVRIIPVGGAKYVKRLYEYLVTPFKEHKDTIKGKVFCLIDTDISPVTFETPAHDNLFAKRLLNSGSKTKLEVINNPSNTPDTSIEDCLNYNLFIQTILQFDVEDEELRLELSSKTPKADDVNSYFGLNLNLTCRQKLLSFFNIGNNKYLFSKEYVSNPLVLNENNVPEWIGEIKRIINT